MVREIRPVDKADSNKQLKLPKPLNPKLKELTKKLFGFQEARIEKFLRSPKLDEVAVAKELTAIQVDLNWIKRILWLIVCGGGLGFFFQ